LAGWLISSSHAAAQSTSALALAGLVLLTGVILVYQGFALMELIAALAMFGFVLVLVYCALDLVRRWK
jgi:prepilin-type N-terminal cleavage/methylation domain-containing protein